MDQRKIRKLCSDLVLEKGPRGAQLYDSLKALPALYGGDVGERECEDVRFTHIRADKADLELKEMQGELLPKFKVVRDVQLMFGAVRSRLLSLPAKAAPEVSSIGQADSVPVATGKANT